MVTKFSKEQVTKPNNILDYYKKYTRILTKIYGDRALNNIEVNKLAKKILGKIFISVYAIDTVPKVLPKKCMLIFNTDKANKSGEHWIALYKSGNIHYIYDSFGRRTKNIASFLHKQILTDKKSKIIDFEHDPEQADYQNNCSLRCITALHCVKKFGIRKAITI